MNKPSKTQRKRLAIYNKQKGKCIYCPTIMWSRGAHPKGHADKMATFEHIHPKGLGGGKESSNLACSCSRCNRYRGQIDHFKFMEIRKQKNWQQLAQEEKWKLDGIYDRKRREFRFKRFRLKYKDDYPFIYNMYLDYKKAQRFKNKHWHFVKVRYYKIKKSIPQHKKDLRGSTWRLRNKTKSLILNTFKRVGLQSFKPLSH